MFAKKIASLALVGLMMIGGSSTAVFAAEPDSVAFTTQAQTMNAGTGMTIEEFKESGMTLEGLKNAKENLDAKGLTLDEAQAKMNGRIEDFATANGITVEEAQAQLEAFKESGKTIEGLENIRAELDAKGITLEDAKENFEAMLGNFAAASGLSLEEAQAIIAEFKAEGKTFEDLNDFKAELDAKGITLDEAKANFEGMFNEFTTVSGLSPEDAKAQISEMKANGKTLEGLRNIQDIIGNIPTE